MEFSKDVLAIDAEMEATERFHAMPPSPLIGA
jgi:hypothetical protein